MDPNWYGSIAGIIVFTIAIVQGLKKWFADSTNFFAQLPTPVYTVVVALVLTAVAHYGLGTLPADQGVARLFMDALTAALGAAGLFEIARPSNLTKSIADSGKKLVFAFLVIGCATVTAACAGKQYHYQVASYGAQASAIAVKAQQAVVEADKAGLLKNKQLTANAMVEFAKLGKIFQDLGVALRAYDALTGNEQAAQGSKIKEILVEARKLTRAVMIFVDDDGTATQLLLLWENLDRIFDTITAAFPRTEPAPVQ